MKHILTASVLCMLIATSLRAGQAINSVSASTKQIAMTMYGQPNKAETKLLPFVEGQLLSGKRERFGIHFGGVPTTTTVVEILGPGNNVTKSISLNELLGNGSRGSTTARATSVLNERRVETIYDVPVSSGTVQLVLRGIVTGDDNAATSKQQLIVSFELRSADPMTAGLRVTLPVSGTADQADHGFVISPKTGAAAVAASLYPREATASVKNNRIVLTSPVGAIGADRAVASIWFVLASFSATNAKTEATSWITANTPAPDDPRVLIVSSADKKATQPRDTVTYTLVCVNFGTGTATDVALTNPIPKGTAYVDQSAQANGFTMSLDRVGASRSGEVISITWKAPQPLLSGEERIVSFKVMVR